MKSVDVCRNVFQGPISLRGYVLKDSLPLPIEIGQIAITLRFQLLDAGTQVLDRGSGTVAGVFPHRHR